MPTPQNSWTYSNNSSAVADELFECVWPLCGVGSERVKVIVIGKRTCSSCIQCKLSLKIIWKSTLMDDTCISSTSDYWRVWTVNLVYAIQFSSSINHNIDHLPSLSVRIWGFSGPYFPAFGLNMERYLIFRMWENADQKNSEYGHFLRSA